MTTIIHGLAAGVVLAGCAIGLASPASADLTDGTYQVTYQGDPAPRTLIVTSCGDGCKRTQIAGALQPVDFHLQGDTWTADSSEPVVTIDDNTLGGSSDSNLFSLVKIG
ncbi:MAG TPA: hypothetical protein VJR50_09815 [Mycobacterium sp.]|nr:hypothetical protein [Mycobacterium sp.]